MTISSRSSRREARGSVATGGLPRVAWHISTRSENGGGSCVEAGPLVDASGRVAVRHSHHPDGTTFVYTRDEWDAFLTGIKSGEFDLAG